MKVFALKRSQHSVLYAVFIGLLVSGTREILNWNIVSNSQL